MFQAMKMYCLLSAVSDSEPGPPLAHEALRLATLGGARSAMLDDRIGALKPGFKADIALLDMNDTAYLPYNSAARQLVYTETGRSIDTVIIDGRVVMKDRVVQTIDEDALREEIRDLMRGYIADYDDILKSRETALPHMLEMHRRIWNVDIGLQRFIARTR
jgi:cytosine/adenosine deaminase-related metal-dependent hydrolase